MVNKRLCRRLRPRGLYVVIALSAPLLAGCGHNGPEVAKVQGKVLLNGKPLTKGFIATMPNAGRGSHGIIQSDGSFELSTFGNGDGAIIGVQKVAIAAYDGTQKSPESGYGKLLVPKRYTDIDASKLTIEVKSGELNAPTLELTSP